MWQTYGQHYKIEKNWKYFLEILEWDKELNSTLLSNTVLKVLLEQ